MSNSIFNSQKLVFDIETTGVDFDSLDEISQEYLSGGATDEASIEEAKNKLGLSPFTGEVVAIGILNPDTGKGAVYLNDSKSSNIDFPSELEEGIIVEKGSEKDILKKFWETAKSYNCFVTYNGRGFDVPFLMIRSAILGIKPTKNLMSNRYVNSQNYNALHIDLYDQLTFYGSTRNKASLHLVTKAFGIKSPKEEGVAGDDVKKLFEENKILDIGRYNLRDIQSTSELYKKWNELLNL